MKRTLFIILLISAGIGRTAVAQDNLILINGGSYKMGDFTDVGYKDARPLHDVVLDPFYMSKYQLTVGEFADFVKETGYVTDCEKKGGGSVFLIEDGRQKLYFDSLACWKYTGHAPNDRLPVTFVSWVDAINYCNWKSEKESLQCCYQIIGDSVSWNKPAKGYRLLTEAEWEFVARSGGKDFIFAWGNDSLPMINGQNAANIKDQAFKNANLPDAKIKPCWPGYNDGFIYPSPVGSFVPNELGIYDICGNVYEWCWDWYGTYSETPATNPTGPATGEKRVCRNVGYACPIEQVGATHRGASKPNNYGVNMGFRIGRSK